MLSINSVRRYGGVYVDPVAAGRELGVEAVLDGTIQRSADRIRATARLVRVDDGRTLWAGQFDGSFSDIFAVQDSISERVVGELALTLTSEERGLLAKRYTADAEAYELYLKGRYFWNKRSREGTAPCRALDSLHPAPSECSCIRADGVEPGPTCTVPAHRYLLTRTDRSDRRKTR